MQLLYRGHIRRINSIILEKTYGSMYTAEHFITLKSYATYFWRKLIGSDVYLSFLLFTFYLLTLLQTNK